MQNHKSNHKTGFTIIEVSLVLAIAGLIFLMAFFALVSFRASERDTERRTHITSLLQQILNYQMASHGSLPTGTFSEGIVYNAEDTSSKTSWQAFYNDYLGSNFEDPKTGMYELVVVACDATKATEQCRNIEIKDSQISDLEIGTIKIITQATCEYKSDIGYRVAVFDSNPRKVAVMINTEASGPYCADS